MESTGPSLKRKRQSCEACRSRKVKCTGEPSGCCRCAAASIPCRYLDQKDPGRPKKRRSSSSEPQQSSGEETTNALVNPHIEKFEASLLDEQPTSCEEAAALYFQDCVGDEFISSQSPALSGFWDSFPADFTLQSDTPTRSGFPVSRSTKSCSCLLESENAIKRLRQIRHSHLLVPAARHAADVTETLLACPVCFDMSKQSLFNIENVLLIGRLMTETAQGYRQYFSWLEGHARELEISGGVESFTVLPSTPAASMLDFKISGKDYRRFMLLGIKSEIDRLRKISRSFSERQRARHALGHEACSKEGPCAKLTLNSFADPLEICPKNPDAHRLIWCFRIVDDVKHVVTQVEEAAA